MGRIAAFVCIVFSSDMKFLLGLLSMASLVEAYCRCRGGPEGSAVVCKRTVNVPQALRVCEKATRMVVLGSIRGGLCNSIDVSDLLSKHSNSYLVALDSRETCSEYL